MKTISRLTRLGFLMGLALWIIFLNIGSACSSEAVLLQLAWKHQFQFAGYYAALHKGFYAEAGFDVAIHEGSEGRFAREEVLNGQAQYGVAGAELILHRAEGDPFVVLAPIFQHSASIILTRADSNIAHPQDLIGKRLMLLPENKDADILAIFQNEGIPLYRIHRIDQSYNVDDLIEGRTDAVSAYLTNEPWLLEQAGIEPGIILPQTYGVDFYSDCLFTTEEEIEKHPKRVRKFLSASLRGWDYAMAHPEEIIDLLIHHYGVQKSRDHLRYEARTMENLIFPTLVEMGHMNPGRWRHIADTFARLGVLPENFSLEGFLYDPDPKPDIRKLRFALFTVLFGLLFAGILILVFFKMNRKLRAEVAERIKTEDSLRDSETRLRTIFDTSRAGIILVNPEGIIHFANQGMADMFRCTLQELIGSAYPKHVHPDQRHIGDRKMKQLIAGDIDFVALERHYIRVDGSDFWGFLSGRRHEDHQGNLISLIGIIADITEPKKLEYELRQAHKMESIGTLTGGVAHDFNNILTAIIGYAELVFQDIPKESPAFGNLQEIKSAALRAAGIVKQLLNFSRKTDQELKPLGVVPAIEETLRLLRSTIPATIDIRRHLRASDLNILADPIQFNQVLLNICANASQAMEEAGGIMEITVEKALIGEEYGEDFSDLPSGMYARISVADNGPGIDPGIIDRIFDPYFTTKEVGKGSGMGLAVVHGIVKNHGGAITVTSRPGKGAAFSMLFPVIEESPSPDLITVEDIPKGTETILFVDDEDFITDIVQEMLTQLGYTVETKSNPIDALDTFRKAPRQFNLVITDMTMPKMTGDKLFEKIKEIRPDIPVIICTGYSPLMDEEKSEKLGVAGLLMKPFVGQEIACLIRKVLDERSSC